MGCVPKSDKKTTQASRCAKGVSQTVHQIPKNRLCIVLFPHSGDEYLVRTSGQSPTAKISPNGGYDVYWNCSQNHYRRLVMMDERASSYIDRKWRYHEKAEERLCVWTEWESITRADVIAKSSNPLDAHFFHQLKRPVSLVVAAKNPSKYYGKGNPSNAQNTDPCIFGDMFKYTICRQWYDPWLRELAQNALIMFWSHKGNSFCLDTVFVVSGNPIDYITGASSRIKCSRMYRNLTLDRLGHGSSATFYRGVPYDKCNPPPIYSFAPASICSDTCNYARRCEFDAKDIAQLNAVIGNRFVNANAHFRSKSVCCNLVTIQRVWRKLAELVFSKGFVLGVHFDWP